MFAKKFLLFSIALLAVQLTALCQPYYFRHYEVESGLSNNAVTCSIQDTHGFMWFGTRDGIDRFDGHTFKVYRFNTKFRNEISGNNFIHSLHVDASGSLLLATEKEIYRYHTQLDSFILLVSSRYFPVDEMITDKKGNIWFNASGVLQKYSPGTGQIKVYEPQTFFYASGVSVDEKGTLWVATGNGLLKKYDEASDSFTTFDLFAGTPQNQARNANIIYCTGDGKILVGSDRAGIKIFYIATSIWADMPLCCENISNLFVRSFVQVSPTEIWIGTETGIFIYNPLTGSSRKIQKNIIDQYALSDNVIYTLCKDREGGIWVGTYFGGLNYYPKQFTPFQKYYYQPSKNSLGGNIVREIKGDSSGNIWIGTEDGGLNKLKAGTGNFIQYKPDQTRRGVAYIGIHDLLAVGNELWVGTFEHGLDILNIHTGKVVRHYNASSETGLRSNFPFCLLETAAGAIVVGTSYGIYRFNRTRNYFEPIANLPQTVLYMCLLEDTAGTLWAGVPGKGVYYANQKTGASGNFHFNPADPASLSSDKVNSIFEDRKGNLWFATENGLCKWNVLKAGFTRYGTAEGFPSNFMLSVLEDADANLWVSTTQGLVCFNPQTRTTQVYTTANGLLSNQFNFSSAFKDRDGSMYFGSAKGLVSFQPTTFSRDNYIPPVYLTGLQVNNQTAGIDSKGSPLTQSISFTDAITLQYDQSTFSIDFAALGFTAPDNLEYAYWLEGLPGGWTYVKADRKVNFTNLAAGTYLFKVKASSSGGTWNHKETQLSIKVLPPWWESWWAYATYILLGVLLAYYLFKNYHKGVEAKNRRKIELLELAKEKEVMQLEVAKEKEILQLELAREKETLESKIEFFTNVAHEIRTPLTLIKVPLATVMRKSAGIPVVGNCLKIMENNTNRLIELTNQLLDFRQTEIRGFSLSMAETNISEVLSDAYNNFLQLAVQNGVSIEMNLPPAPLLAFVDKSAFEKIIYNLFSNAVKYAATTVQLTLVPYNSDGNTFTIYFKNDGHLIPEHLKDKIFEPFYRVKEPGTKSGTGIGLALARSLAQLHGGGLQLEETDKNMNIFSLTLPAGNESENA